MAIANEDALGVQLHLRVAAFELPEPTLAMRRAVTRLSQATICCAAAMERMISPPETRTVSNVPSRSGSAARLRPEELSTRGLERKMPSASVPSSPRQAASASGWRRCRPTFRHLRSQCPRPRQRHCWRRFGPQTSAADRRRHRPQRRNRDDRLRRANRHPAARRRGRCANVGDRHGSGAALSRAPRDRAGRDHLRVRRGLSGGSGLRDRAGDEQG